MAHSARHKAAIDCTGHLLVLLLLSIRYGLWHLVGYLYESHQTIALIIAGDEFEDGGVDAFIVNSQRSEAAYKDWRENKGGRKRFKKMMMENSTHYSDWRAGHVILTHEE